jgi:Flp pilus assembly protein TadB
LTEAVEGACSQLGLSDHDLLAVAARLQDDDVGETAAALNAIRETVARRRQLRHLAMKGRSRLAKATLGLAIAMAVVVGLLAAIAPPYVEPLFSEGAGRVAIVVGFFGFILGWLAVFAIADRRVAS